METYSEDGEVEMQSKTLQKRPEIVGMPSVELAVDAVERKFGLHERSSVHSDLIAMKHWEIKQATGAGSVAITPVGFRTPLVKREWSISNGHGNDWVLVPMAEDQLFQEGDFLVPGHILRNIRKAEKLQVFDDYYIAHEVLPVPNRNALSPIPWEDIKSPQQKYVMSMLNASAHIDQAAYQGVMQVSSNIKTAFGVLATAIVALVVIAAILMAVAAVVVIAIGILAVIVSSIGVLLILGLIGGTAAGVDPIVYGVIYNENGTVASLYKLGDWKTK